MLPLYGTAHMWRTTRFGDNPRASVLDANCKATSSTISTSHRREHISIVWRGETRR